MSRLAALVLILSTAAAAAPQTETPRGREEAPPTEVTRRAEAEAREVITSFDAARKDYLARLTALPPGPERDRFAVSGRPDPLGYAARAWAALRRAPATPSLLDETLWVYREGGSGPDAAAALERLAVGHAGDDGLAALFPLMHYRAEPRAAEICRALRRKSSSRRIRAEAIYALSRLEFGIDGDPARGEALLVELERDFAGVRRAGGTFGELAARELFALRHLAVGREAPDIRGRDVDDRPLTLSEHRGKVVLLSFWGDW
ncbi:MAG: hypothetical protein R3F20_17445 [Planctomycetota bacterium]